ncbi:hypothetical protein PV327_000871 [Microctonus hyperodae]|uniref:Cuticle protein 6 n=1 Tax=Microctonus hyperodae TaxID=165561 RepID=A0AA39L2L8_MICHY|nr:hypothetical protein PV327_000871 [Microctonus hyperodae]
MITGFELISLLGLFGFALCSPIWPGVQFHDQNGAGSYRYGYQGPHHAKMETRSNGITQGGYSYVDANGVLQSVAYTADAVNGFRVRASNLPQPPTNPLLSLNETPEVMNARKQHLAEYKRIENSLNDAQNNIDNKQIKNPFLLSQNEASNIEIPKPNYFTQAAPISQNLPIGQYSSINGIYVPTTTQVVYPVPYGLVHSSLRHTQDSLGQYDYSYASDTSAKSESRSLDGTTRGAYSYIDANGLLQQVHYIADHNGFRVLATNLPEA